MIDTMAARTVDDRRIAATRFILASSALLIIYLDPSEPDRYVSITYAALVLYTLYSGSLYLFAIRNNSVVHSLNNWSHWADVVWYLVLISLSSGTGSIFFFFFFFSILVASFRWGFASGLRVVIVSSILFTIIGYVTAPAEKYFELNRFLLRPIYLVALGYMMAYWGGYEIMLKLRLALLKEVSIISNPRFGVRRTLGMIVERLRAFYNADTCLLIVADRGTEEYQLFRADPGSREAVACVEPVTPEIRDQLLALPAGHAVVYIGKNRYMWPPGGSYHAYDIEKNERTMEGRKTSETLANMFDARSFVSVPLSYHKQMVGRVYLTSQRRFDHSDADFLHQVFERVMPVIDNIRLVDRLASNAAETERQRIARDIHDSVIQPYIGLQIGLAAISQKLAAGRADVSRDIGRLAEMTDLGISDLRNYVLGLKGTVGQEGSLLPSVRRFAAKFAEATGIAVQVDAENNIHVNDRLAAEAFQMVAEGLSNIRRHTQAHQALIKLECLSGWLGLRIENEGTNGAERTHFTPRSIADRAVALGGQVEIEQRADGGSAVIVKIPL